MNQHRFKYHACLSSVWFNWFSHLSLWDLRCSRRWLWSLSHPVISSSLHLCPPAASSAWLAPPVQQRTTVRTSSTQTLPPPAPTPHYKQSTTQKVHRCWRGVQAHRPHLLLRVTCVRWGWWALMSERAEVITNTTVQKRAYFSDSGDRHCKEVLIKKKGNQWDKWKDG